MSTLRISNIEAKAFPSSPSVDEKVKVTNSSGDILLHLDGTTSGIGSIGIGTTGTTFRVDPNNTVTFPGNVISSGIITASSLSGNLTGNVTGNVTGTVTQLSTNATGANLTLTGNLGVGGTITYEDVARVDATGVSTFREGLKVGPLTGIALTAYTDGSIRTSGIVTATSFSGSGTNLTSLPAAQLTGTLPAIDGSSLTGVGVGTADNINTSGIVTATAIVSDFAPVNVIINGAMQVNQRGSGTLTVNSSSAQYPCDRWMCRGEGGSAAYTIAQVSVASNGIGIRNAIKITSSQATSVGASSLFYVRQMVEGYNIQRFNLGEAGCKSMVLSFWVKTSVAGSHSGAISNSAENRSYPFTFTCTANNWHNVKIAIPPITSGSFNEENGVGLRVIFDFGSGDNFRGTAGQWNSAQDVGATGAARLMETSGGNMYLTMVQLEEGTVATPYEKRPFDSELKRCQRYYYQLPGSFPMFADRTTDAHNCGRTGLYYFKQTMRASPSMSNMSMTVYTGSAQTLGAYSVTPDFCWFNHSGSFSDGRAWAKINSFTADAEI